MPGSLPSLRRPYMRASRSIAASAAMPLLPSRPAVSKIKGDTLCPYLLRFSTSPAAAATPPRFCAVVYRPACAQRILTSTRCAVPAPGQ
eukprot:12584942-Heterocapsa_arctica.AAC.1